MRNLVSVIKDIASNRFYWYGSTVESSNQNSRQAQGVDLEHAVKDLLAGVWEGLHDSREDLYTRHLAYQGSANNPPDAMLRGGNQGDAFEIKKIASPSKSALELNSSPPYSHLTADNSRITLEAKNCETWDKRDFFYAIGHINQDMMTGNWLWIVQGSVFAQDHSFYRGIENDLRPAVSTALENNGLEPALTNELGKVNGLDSLGITNLRVRPMWTIANPTKLFATLEGVNETRENYLTVHILLEKSKWDDLIERQIEVHSELINLEVLKQIAIHEVEVEDPNDGSQTLKCMLIRVIADKPD